MEKGLNKPSKEFRILEKTGRFYPQKRVLFLFWDTMTSSYPSLASAKGYLREYVILRRLLRQKPRVHEVFLWD
jgi:hypothetical protein